MCGRMILVIAASVVLPGCIGWGVKPMPQRLNEEGQARYEYGWNHLVSLGTEVDRATLLDTMLVRGAWIAGVDQVYFRAEKQVGVVRVVMETNFERTLADGDVFQVTFYDAQGQILRQEVFTGAEIDAAMDLLTSPLSETSEQPDPRDAERRGRLQRVAEVFPEPPDPNAAGEP